MAQRNPSSENDRNEFDPTALEAAAHLLSRKDAHRRAEGNVKADVLALVRAMDVGTIESEYQTGVGPADIYLPNRRAVLELKARPKAQNPSAKPQGGESPKEQLDRYVRTLIESELGQLQLWGEKGEGNSEWTGIITDGTHWHVYRYPHEENPASIDLLSRQFVNEADGLVAFVTEALGTDMVGKQWVPRRPGYLFSELKQRMDGIHRRLPQEAQAATDTKRKLWLDMMSSSGMVPKEPEGQQKLFLAHSFLILIVRLVSHSLRGRGMDDLTEPLRDGFASWILDVDNECEWVQALWELVDRYDWRQRRGDVLRELYEQYVNASDRKVFGEYYTPDWLAEFMVHQVLDDQWLEDAAKAAHQGHVDGVGVLDPACGSGTFLYYAALRILQGEFIRTLRPGDRANVVARLVNGMDVHPVAVEMARVNLERALAPGEPTEGESAYRVFLGDSLQIDGTEDGGDSAGMVQQDAFRHSEDTMVLTTPKWNRIEVPLGLVRSPSFAEHFRRMVNAAVDRKPLPPGIADDNGDEKLEACHAQLTEVIEREGNSVWTWYGINVAGPLLLSERKVDRIVANPPWVTLGDIQVKHRKGVMEDFGRRLRLQEGGRQAANLDIASFFVLRARALYMTDPSHNPGAWLVKRSALRSGQWLRFRNQHSGTLTQSVDLEALRPFGNGDARRCCLLMEHCRVAGRRGASIKAVPRAGQQKIEWHDPLARAERKFRFLNSEVLLPQAPSEYGVTNIRKGATIIPHVLTFVESHSEAAPHGWSRIRTGRSTKGDWKDVESREGKVPTEWIRPLHRSPDMAPYIAKWKHTNAIVPVDGDGRFHADPGRACAFWEELDEVYEEHRGIGDGTATTLRNQLDHMGKLSSQPLVPKRGRRMVLYPASGEIMRAARARAGEAVVEETLYWFEVASQAEAGYLVAILNAPCLKRAFNECRSSGRHFHLHPWRKVPIPKYDKRCRSHRSLAELCTRAEAVARGCAMATLADRPNLQQVGLSAAIREAVAASEVGQEINRIVTGLLPDQVD